MDKLDLCIAEINKSFKSTVIKKGTDMIYVEKIPFTSPRATYMTYGGIPIGKATEFLGPEGGGKTTSALIITGQAQKKALRDWEEELNVLNTAIEELSVKTSKTAVEETNKLTIKLTDKLNEGPRKVVYLDIENTLDEDWAKLNGVDIEELILARPQEQSAEEVLQMVLDLIDTGRVELLVIDSIPMLISEQLYDKDLEKKSYGGISGVLTEFSRKVSAKLSRHHTALIGINQVREDFQNPFNLYASPGGRAWKHLCALRMYFRKGSFIDERNVELKNSAAEPHGNLVDITIVKTKICKPDRRVGQYTIKYDMGADILSDTIYMAIKYNIIIQTGSWFNINDRNTGELLKDEDGATLKIQGVPNLLDYLREDDQIYSEIYEEVNKKLSAV